VRSATHYVLSGGSTWSRPASELDRIAALDQREVRLNARRLNCGVVITLAFLAASVYLIATGHGVEGTVLGVIFIIGIMPCAFGHRR
jgi:hypothetical protein